MHPRCKRGRVGVGENRNFYLLRYKRKFYASALQTRTSRVGKIGILFIALQTQILCIRVANADEWE